MPTEQVRLPVITNIAEFWTLSEADKKRPVPVKMDLIVYYYDAAWSILYGEVGGAPSYLPVRGRALPIKSGQRVLLEGTVIQANGFDGALVKATVLAEGSLPEPVLAAGRLKDIIGLRGRWMEIEGYIPASAKRIPRNEAKLLSDNHLIDLVVQFSVTDPGPAARRRPHSGPRRSRLPWTLQVGASNHSAGLRSGSGRRLAGGR